MTKFFREVRRALHIRTGNACLIAAIAGLAAVLLIAGVDTAFARAGGGGGNGGGGGIVTLILLPFFLIYSGIVTWIVARKNRQSRALLSRLEEMDKTWALATIKSRIEQAFFKLQHAWVERDHAAARGFMSDRLYRKHHMQTEQMRREGRKNVLEQINLESAKIVEVADFRDDTKDRIWVHIEGSTIDYTVDEKTGEVVAGNKDEKEHFQELWKMIRAGDSWVVDEIDQDAGISSLLKFDSLHEAAEPIALRT